MRTRRTSSTRATWRDAWRRWRCTRTCWPRCPSGCRAPSRVHGHLDGIEPVDWPHIEHPVREIQVHPARERHVAADHAVEGDEGPAAIRGDRDVVERDGIVAVTQRDVARHEVRLLAVRAE